MPPLIFAILVILGFTMWFLATWPVAFAERIARGLFLAAALVWAWAAIGGH
jgi:hypothetical protein